METKLIIVSIGRSKEEIAFLEESLEKMEEYIDAVSFTTADELYRLYEEDIKLLRSLGMSYEEYPEGKILSLDKTIEERKALTFNRPTIRHQVINRKPKHLIKKIIR